MNMQTFVRPEILKNTGAVLYEGRSLLDGKPIVAILTYGSKNSKTGDMAQLWILCQDVAPTEATRNGADASICGDCPHRGIANGKKAEGRSCYVLVHQAPTVVWKKWKAGKYPRATYGEAAEIVSRKRDGVRLGAYGDPAALPLDLLEALTSRAKQWTGYTHQWRHGFALQNLVMASADNQEQAKNAEKQGWRAFYVSSAPEPRVTSKTMFCPASEEMGRVKTCATCGACAGLSSPRKATIVQIAAHGAMKKNVERRQKLIAPGSLAR